MHSVYRRTCLQQLQTPHTHSMKRDTGIRVYSLCTDEKQETSLHLLACVCDVIY